MRRNGSRIACERIISHSGWGNFGTPVRMRLSQDADNLPKRSESPGGGIWSFHVVVADVDRREGRFLLGGLRVAPTQKKSGWSAFRTASGNAAKLSRRPRWSH